MSTYNGWTNYETWAVKLWLDNDEHDQQWMLDFVRDNPNDYEAAEALRDGLDRNMPELSGVWADLLRTSFDSVNFREIVENVREDLDEDEDEEDMTCNQCEAAMINGTYCHETGCPNARKVKVDGEWITPDEDEDE